MEYNRTRIPRTPGRSRRYGAQGGWSGKGGGKTGLFSVLIGQTIVCAAVLIFALVFRFANNDGYREFKNSINSSFLGSGNLAELTARFEEFTQKSEVFAGIFGPEGAIPIFRFNRDSSSQSSSQGDNSNQSGSQSDTSGNSSESSGQGGSQSGSSSGSQSSSATVSVSPAAAPVGGDAFFYDEIILEDLYTISGYANLENNIQTRIVLLPQPLAQPLKEGWVSSPFADRENPFTKKREFHPAVDVAVPQGTPVYAAMDGTVNLAGSGEKSGRYILLLHSGDIKTIYAHLSAFKVTAGDRVKAGQLIALSGNTGASTGPHVHFEIRQNDKYMDPALYFKCFT